MSLIPYWRPRRDLNPCYRRESSCQLPLDAHFPGGFLTLNRNDFLTLGGIERTKKTIGRQNAANAPLHSHPARCTLMCTHGGAYASDQGWGAGVSRADCQVSGVRYTRRRDPARRDSWCLCPDPTQVC